MNILTFFSIFFTLFIGTATQECQCPTPGESTPPTCLGYDRKLQANTLDEAIANFPDLTLEEEAEEPSDDEECVTKECQDCRKDMRKQLKKIGLLEKDVNEALASANATSSCTRYRFVREKEKSLAAIEETQRKLPYLLIRITAAAAAIIIVIIMVVVIFFFFFV
uniref:Transmembrane protein n=1 Tax=Caenorhabditis japonica TaxID=281687 RepID=A0A8R1I0L7_CAEJA